MTTKPHIPAVFAWKVANEVVSLLSGCTEKIQVAGSLRRGKEYVGDVEILAIPLYSGVLDLLDYTLQQLIANRVLQYRLNKNGHRTYGPQNKLLAHVSTNVSIDIFTTDESRWPMSLVIRTGGKETNIMLAKAAISNGWKLNPYGRGYTTPRGEYHCRTERDVFESVGLTYIIPNHRI